MKYQKGDVIVVKVGGVPYETVIDEHGVQRFRQNKVIGWLFDNGRIDLNQLAREYQYGKFDKRAYAEFNMMLNYSVSGFAELSAFQDWDIENPLWDPE